MQAYFLLDRNGVDPLAKKKGFTLIELLVVLAIVAILAVVSLPAISSLSTTYYLSGSANTLAAAFNYARQEASTLNVPVEVRFYQYAIAGFPNEPANGGFHAYQLYEDLSSGNVPLSRIQFLPGRIVFSPSATLSPLVTSPPGQGTTSSALGNVPNNSAYISFTFRPNGTTNIASGNNSNFLTLVDAANTGTPPPNYVTLVIDPISGTSKMIRP